MREVGETLLTMGSAQLVAAFLFLAGYGFTIGRLVNARGRRYALFLALLSGASFVALTRPWVHGALLLASAVLCVGAFVAVVWVVSLLLIRSARAGRDASPAGDMPAGAGSVPIPAPGPASAHSAAAPRAAHNLSPL